MHMRLWGSRSRRIICHGSRRSLPGTAWGACLSTRCGWCGRPRHALLRCYTLGPRSELWTDSRLLQLLNHGTHTVSMLCWQGGRILDLQFAGRHCTFQMTQKGCCILFRPQVDIQGVKLLQILLLVSDVISRQMPLALILHRRVDFEGEQDRLLVRKVHLSFLETAGESILIRRAGMIGDLELGLLAVGTVIEVQIAAPSKAMMRGLGRWVGEVVVHVGEERGQ